MTICLMMIIFNDHIILQNSLADSVESDLGCSWSAVAQW